MKVAILTQPLHSNYGGLLQNYALQSVLKEMGHDVITIDRHIARSNNFFKDIIKRILQFIQPSYDISLLTYKQKMSLAHLQQQFIERHIHKTERIFSQKVFDNYVAANSVDAYIVGSDQCWRPCYSANIYNYYLDFVNKNCKKIAYAASFGVDTWEYRDDVTAKVSDLVKTFDFVSVREQSAVALCSERLGVDASWVLDPTMLLGKDGFMRFVSPAKSDYVLDYLLEESKEARDLVQAIKVKTQISDVRSNIASSVFHRGESIESHQNISVEEWLSNIYNASFVVTDSFHGAVFSILFNIPFVVKLNSVRGNTRLESLLADFGLEHCICHDVDKISVMNYNWERINAHLELRRKESRYFLEKSLV